MSRKFSRRMLLLFRQRPFTATISGLSALLLLLIFSFSIPATDYYVCSDLGDDLAPGTSSAAPWRTVGRVNQMVFRGGDRIFFSGGQVFDDAGLRLTARTAAGDDGTRIVIGSYGGRPAVLRPPLHDNGIQLTDVAGITIQNLIIEGPGREISDTPRRGLVRSGIMIHSTRTEGATLSGLTIAGVRISGFYTGILLLMSDASTVGYRDILIAGCSIFANVHSGIDLYASFKSEHPRAAPNGESDFSKPISEVLITGCDLSAHYGTELQTFPMTSGCGIMLSAVDGAVIERCTIHDNGGKGAKEKVDSCGIMLYNAENVAIRRCLVYGQNRWGGPFNRADGISLNSGTSRTTVAQCAVYGCQSSAFSVQQWYGVGSSHSNAILYNVSAGNGGGDHPSLAHLYPGTSSTRVIGNIDVSSQGNSAICDQSFQSANALCNNILVIAGAGASPERRFISALTRQLGFLIAQGNVYWSADKASPGGWQWGGRVYRTLEELRRCPVSAFLGNPPETQGKVATGMQVDPGLALQPIEGAPTTIAGMLESSWCRPAADTPWRTAGVDLDTIRGLQGLPRARTFLNAKNTAKKPVIPGPFGSGAKAPVIISPPVATGVVGRPFTYAIRAVPAPKFFRARGLPPGWSLDERTGVISGLPQHPVSARIILSVGIDALPDGDDELHLMAIIEPSLGTAPGPEPVPVGP
jgi:hypothetical protein